MLKREELPSIPSYHFETIDTISHYARYKETDREGGWMDGLSWMNSRTELADCISFNIQQSLVPFEWLSQSGIESEWIPN
jgi:hypothetical protein